MFSRLNSAPTGLVTISPPTVALGHLSPVTSTVPCDLQSPRNPPLPNPHPLWEQWERSAGDAGVRGRGGGGAQRSVINPVLPLGCRGCSCHCKLDGKHATIFSLQGEKPRLLKGGSHQENRCRVCNFVPFPITSYPSVSWFSLIICLCVKKWRSVLKGISTQLWKATVDSEEYSCRRLWMQRFMSGFCPIHHVHVCPCPDAEAPLTVGRLLNTCIFRYESTGWI